MGADRKQLGAWYTPPELVETIVDAMVTPEFVAARPVVAILDPACGDGRFLAAAATRVARLGGVATVHGVDVDPAAVAAARTAVPSARIDHADALAVTDWVGRYDLVVGNPPFLSQMAAQTSRGGASRRGGGPYADAAVEFLALAAELVEADGGRVALVFPQSLLSSRDATPIRDRIAGRASLIWSWWTGQRVFDAQVHTCALGFEFSASPDPIDWSGVVTSRQGIPALPEVLGGAGRLGDRATLNANFRDEYYGMAPAVGDHAAGPRLITSGLIDPGTSLWGRRPITFARQRWIRPRIDIDRLDDKMRLWAQRRLVPKVLVANQTRLVEAICDPLGAWLPAVPVVSVYPTGSHWDDRERRGRDDLATSAWTIAAVLTSGFASTWAWHRGAGTGLGANAIRISPVVLADLPWPSSDLTRAVDALRSGDLHGCAAAVDAAYGIASTGDVGAWWRGLLERVESRQPAEA